MRRSGFIGVLVLASVAVVSGLIGYNAGLTSSAVASGATVVVTGGYPGFGTLFFLLFVGFLFFGVAGRKRAWMGHHGHGPWGGGRGGFGPGGFGGPGGAGGPGAGFGPMGNPSDPRRQWVAEMHRRLHEDEAKGAGAGSSQAGPGNPAGSAGSTGPSANLG